MSSQVKMIEANNGLRLACFFRKKYTFSNHYECVINVSGKIFTTTEQYFMYIKAKTFGDEKAAQDILNTSSPQKAKQIGRKVKNFDGKNPELRKELLDTGDCVIVEASPFDKFWGTGIGMSDKRIKDPAKWGTNMLGQVLMEIREEFRSQMDQAKSSSLNFGWILQLFFVSEVLCAKMTQKPCDEAYSALEDEKLIRAYFQYFHIVDVKCSTNVSQKEKKSAWDEIAKAVNSADNCCIRDIKSVKTRYKNIHAGYIKYNIDMNQPRTSRSKQVQRLFCYDIFNEQFAVSDAKNERPSQIPASKDDNDETPAKKMRTTSSDCNDSSSKSEIGHTLAFSLGLMYSLPCKIEDALLAVLHKQSILLDEQIEHTRLDIFNMKTRLKIPAKITVCYGSRMIDIDNNVSGSEDK
ncbi:myb/SANT-like DNA-binding domain-containing protein [Ditylenchus destructor]|nr:myb/SANT-like DNA-binding domain-containing protein [Ditylenchus destructor]